MYVPEPPVAACAIICIVVSPAVGVPTVGATSGVLETVNVVVAPVLLSVTVSVPADAPVFSVADALVFVMLVGVLNDGPVPPVTENKVPAVSVVQIVLVPVNVTLTPTLMLEPFGVIVSVGVAIVKLPDDVPVTPSVNTSVPVGLDGGDAAAGPDMVTE